jgi:hypothetical protein
MAAAGDNIDATALAASRDNLAVQSRTGWILIPTLIPAFDVPSGTPVTVLTNARSNSSVLAAAIW